MKTSVKIALAFLLLIGGVIFARPFAADLVASDVNTMIWDAGRYRVTFPKTWKEHKGDAAPGRYAAFDPESGVSISITRSLQEKRLPPDYVAARVLENFGEDLEKFARAESPDYHRLSLVNSIVDGRPAIDWWYTTKVDGAKRLRGQRLIFRGAERLIAALSSPDPKSSRLKPILETFRLLKDPAFEEACECQLTLPSDWEERKDLEGLEEFMATDRNGRQNLVVRWSRKEKPVVLEELEGFGDELEKEARATAPSYQRISRETVKLDGAYALDWSYTVNVGGSVRLHGQRMIFRGDQRMMLSFASLDLKSPGLQAIVKSFRPLSPNDASR